ncbi:MFS transporter [Streptomyces sp. NPDC055006]
MKTTGRRQAAADGLTRTGDSPSLWRTPAFRSLFGASVLSQIGTNVSYVAVPLLAVTELHVSPGQIGALATLSTLAFLLIGLPAGAWVDRMRQRRVLIVADLVRGLLFASVPLAWWLDTLTLGQLYAVVLLNGCATVFFDVGSHSVVPQLVGRDHLVQANAAFVTLEGLTGIGGRSAGGGLVQLLTAPVALAVAAASYLASALGLTPIGRGPAPSTLSVRVRLHTQIAQGLRHVVGNSELRALALNGSLINFGSTVINTMLPLLFVRQLGLPASALGLFWAAGGAGVLLGARCARPVAARLGLGRTLGSAGLWLAPAGLLVPLIDRGPWLLVAGAGWFVSAVRTGMTNVLGVSLRQRMTEDRLLGRMNATFRFMFMGALAIGSALSGVLTELTSLRTTLWVGGACLALAFLPVCLSPVRRRTDLPQG